MKQNDIEKVVIDYIEEHYMDYENIVLQSVIAKLREDFIIKVSNEPGSKLPFIKHYPDSEKGVKADFMRVCYMSYGLNPKSDINEKYFGIIIYVYTQQGNIIFRIASSGSIWNRYETLIKYTAHPNILKIQIDRNELFDHLLEEI